MVRHDYAELHCHSNFSFLDGASHPDDLVERAADLGYRALAITDHNGFYGAVRFSEAARRLGLSAVYGVEVGLPKTEDGGRQTADDPIARAEERDRESSVFRLPSSDSAPEGRRRGRTKRMHGAKPTGPDETEHLVLLAPSAKGHAALSRLVTRAQFRGEKDRPVYDWEDLAEAASSGRLVALTGCHRGAMPSAAETR